MLDESAEMPIVIMLQGLKLWNERLSHLHWEDVRLTMTVGIHLIVWIFSEVNTIYYTVYICNFWRRHRECFWPLSWYFLCSEWNCLVFCVINILIVILRKRNKCLIFAINDTLNWMGRSITFESVWYIWKTASSWLVAMHWNDRNRNRNRK